MTHIHEILQTQLTLVTRVREVMILLWDWWSMADHKLGPIMVYLDGNAPNQVTRIGLTGNTGTQVPDATQTAVTGLYWLRSGKMN
jgi:hypothetical protein